MANEILATAPSGQVLYSVVRNASLQVWNTGTPAFESYNSANYSSYALAMTEQGATGFYAASFPTQIVTAGRYSVVVRQRVGSSAALTDPVVTGGTLLWGGASETDVLASNDKTGYTVSTVQDKTGYTASTVQDKTGYALSSGEHTAISGTDVPAALTAQGYTSARAGYLDTLNGVVAAIWNTLTSALTTSGSIGVLLARLGFDGSNNVKASTQAYAAGQDPATLVLVSAANKLLTTPSGQVQHDLAQAVPTSNTAQTVGDALNAARAGAFGAWTLAGTTLTLYAPNGTTVVRQFALDNALVPSQRV